jgi:hypothetical protein
MQGSHRANPLDTGQRLKLTDAVGIDANGHCIVDLLHAGQFDGAERRQSRSESVLLCTHACDALSCCRCARLQPGCGLVEFEPDFDRLARDGRRAQQSAEQGARSDQAAARETISHARMMARAHRGVCMLHTANDAWP